MSEDNKMTNTSMNVLSFPQKKSINLGGTKSFDEFGTKLQENKERHVDLVIERTMSALYNKLGFEGFDVDNETFYTDYFYVVDALRSALLRQCGLPHPFQEFVDACEKNEEELNTLETP